LRWLVRFLHNYSWQKQRSRIPAVRAAARDSVSF
jgi:hypothetical protein